MSLRGSGFIARHSKAVGSTINEERAHHVDWISRWWRQPDHHEWLSGYLAARDLQRFTQFLVAGCVLALGAVPTLMLWSPSGPQNATTRILSIVVAAMCAIMAVLWTTQWPTRRQSIVFIATASVCVAVSSLSQSSPSSGLQICTAFAALAGYAAFFHTSRALAFTLVLALGTATICAVQIGADWDPFGAISKLLVLAVGLLAVPYSAQVLVHFLGSDALKSDTDPLTELPNRRGFYRSMRVLAGESMNNRSSVLGVVMIDLDAFKRVNDTAGHAAGDQTLIAVADILRRTRRGDSVIGRIGGEEFVVGLIGGPQTASGLAERLRREIAQTPWNVTASVGVATAAPRRVPEGGVRAFIQGLVESADRAMYTAKRAGGDQVFVAGQDRDAYFEDAYADNPMARSTTANNGNVPWTITARSLSGADTNSTSAAANIDPAPAKTKAAPTGIPPEIMNPTPTPMTTARKRL
jgi:diguanylate cyclase (GGDEF)-like protein